MMGTTSEFTSTSTARSTPFEPIHAPARWARSSRSPYVRPPGRDPKATRCPKPPPAISSSIGRCMARASTPLVGRRDGRAVLQRQPPVAERQGAVARLGAQHLEAHLLVGIPLPDLGAV